MKRTIIIFALACVIAMAWGQTAVSPVGDGSEGNPYQIGSLENLYWYQTMGGPGYAIQTDDIDATPTANWNSDGSGGYYGWDPIDNSGGSCNYDGQGYSIDGLYINRSSENSIGLFGSMYGPAGVGNKGTITNIRLSNADITGSQDVGGIIGLSIKYDVSKCYVSGTIDGVSYVGGIAGRLQGEFGTNITISEIISEATVTGYMYTGGTVGSIVKSTMLNSCANGSLVGLMNSNNGGCIGYVAESAMYYCYSASPVTNGGGLVGGSDASGEGGSTATFSYYDYEASGQFMSALGEFKSTAQMTTESTYIGWDFTSTWAINPSFNDGYPYLQAVPTEDALPITLENFSAEYINGKVEISWVTESEENNARFLIYRNNEVIAMIDGAGTTTEPHDYSYIDENVIPGKTYVYKLGDVSYANELVIHEDYAVTVMIDEFDVPETFALEGNYPNPFNPTTTIPFSLTKGGDVSLIIYDMNGKLVRTLLNENMPAGYHDIVWDGKDNNGMNINSGMYISRLVAGEQSDSRKMLMVK